MHAAFLWGGLEEIVHMSQHKPLKEGKGKSMLFEPVLSDMQNW